MTDLLIRNGTVIDGTGAPAFRADVRVRDGVIAEIAENLQPHAGERIFDAAGCHVTPGFIESHTHFDATMWWQPDMDPLPGYGVTTSIMGNCGFSAAPVSNDEQARLEMIKIFSFFEDIPIDPFLKELPWDWRTWPEYRKSLDKNVKTSVNYATFVGHIAIRLAVMGMEAWERAATPAEIEKMAFALEEALKAGAIGLSSNLMDHDGSDRPVPTLHADDAEFSALIEVISRYRHASLQVVLDTFMRMTGPVTLQRIADLCEGKSVRVQWAGLPTLQFQKMIGAQQPMLELHEKFAREGRDFWTGYAHVSPTSVLSITQSLIFAQSNDYVWHEVVLAEGPEAKLALLRNSDWRARARNAWDNDVWDHAPMNHPEALFLANSDNGVGPHDISLAEYAGQLGLHPSDAMAEWIIANGVQSTVQMAPFDLDEEMIIRLLKDPHSVGNISDVPAHGQMLCGAGENLWLIKKYANQLGALTLEEAVHVMTGKLAKFFSLNDRGVLKVGNRADITVFNLDEIECRKKKKVHDVPDGKGGTLWRWTRDPAPMRLTLVNGVPTFEDGRYTGALPGRLLGATAA